MGLPRSPEPFHRVYSPPEAPKAKARRPRFVVFATALFVVIAAAVAVFAYLHQGSKAKSTAKPAATPSSPLSDRPSAKPSAAPPVLAAVPNACSVLPAGTVRRLVPSDSPVTDKMGGEAASVCEYSTDPGGVRFRDVRVAVQAFLPKYMQDRAAGYTVYSYDQLWQEAQRNAGSNGTPRRLTGIGDAAYQRYWVDSDLHIAIGETVVRYRNVVLTIRYSEPRPTAANRPAVEQRCLTESAAAARDGVGGLK